MPLPETPPLDSAQAPRFLALLDYDGTLTTEECNEVVFQRLVGDAWRPFEDEVRAGRMSHAECLRRQVELVKTPRPAYLGALVTQARLAPGVGAFLATLAERRGAAAIVSAGFREVVEAVWRREGLAPVTTFAGELVGRRAGEDQSLSLIFNPAFGDCPHCGPASCKAAVLRALRRPGDVVLVFGDGAGDLCMAREADLTFARAHLAERCAAEGIDWRPLGHFARVWDEVDAWLAGRVS